jgi:glycosyltransferase involved in cell wall biosynthesis
MKVLHLIDSLVMGGKERRLLELLKGIQTMDGIESRLVVLSKTVQYAYAAEIDVHTYYLERSSRRDIRLFSRLKKICQEFGPDIIHSWNSMCSIYAAPVARMLNIRFINAMITNASKVPFLGSRWLRARLTFPFSHLIVANSHAGLSAYKAPARKSRCIYNGFDFSRLTQIESEDVYRQRHGITTPKIVGMVASFDRRKDFFSFVQVANRLTNRRRDVTFIALGDGPTRNACKQRVSRWASDRVKFLGRQSNIESYINLFDVALLLTNPDVHGEGISNAILEYMAIGKPVVATRGGGTEEIVVDDHTGFLVDSKDIDALCAKIQYLLDHEKAAARMGDAGRNIIHKAFTIERMISQYLHVYQTLLQSGACTGTRLKKRSCYSKSPPPFPPTTQSSEN